MDFCAFLSNQPHFISDRLCSDPPKPPSNGGLSTFNHDTQARKDNYKQISTKLNHNSLPTQTGKAHHDLDVSYYCDVARALVDKDGNTHDRQTITCMWSGNWTTTEVWKRIRCRQ